MLKQGKCKHFTGIRDAECKKGVNYVALTADFFDSLPCVPKGISDKREVAKCSFYEEPTPKEIAEDEAWVDAHVNKMRVVMEGIAPLRQRHRKTGFSGVIECPACKGRLHLSISSYNGHAHGRCETPDCVNWME